MRNEGDNKQTNSKHTNKVEEKVAEKVGCFYRLILLEKFIYILNLFAKKDHWHRFQPLHNTIDYLVKSPHP